MGRVEEGRGRHRRDDPALAAIQSGRQKKLFETLHGQFEPEEAVRCANARSKGP
jgi:hypothetical protein